MNYDFCIRLDINRKIGSGHYFRCLALCKRLRQNGMKVVFLIHNEKAFLKHIKDQKFPYFVIDGKTEERRVSQSKKLLKNFENMIIDLPFHNELYSKSLAKFCKTAIIDDIGNKKIYSELLFNGSIVSKFHNYKIRNSKTKFFKGSKFMVLRDEFLKIRKKIVICKRPPSNILITFGGSDDKDITRQIISFLASKGY